MSSSPSSENDVLEGGDASSLDHALLESIFYNEMMMLDDSASLISSSLLSTLAADGSVMREPPAQYNNNNNNNHHEELTCSVSPPVISYPTRTTTTTATVTLVEEAPPPATTYNQYSLSSRKPAAKHHEQQQQQQLQPLPPPTQSATATATSRVVEHQHQKLSVPPGASPLTQKLAGGSMVSRALTSPTPPPGGDLSEGEKRQKLVSQFSALAARLGITLPEPVVQSLTQSKTTTTTTTTVLPATTASPAQQQPTLSRTGTLSITNPSSPVFQTATSSFATASLSPCSPPANGSTATAASTTTIVEELAKVADAAVAAASRKRTVNTSGDESETPSAEHNNTNNHNKKQHAPYSKRRKKPRLQDCESKLAELQAENAMLKRHLANLSSQSAALDQERNMQQQRMVSMLENEMANDAELEDALKHFQEMYSDYGRRRHSELNFHLDQLQRLANPTNFTKLGLWTMGQQSKNSRNPIAGILQKELGISAQQGKKILEQRKRIQDVCSNLKECLGLLANLKALCKQKTQIFHDRISKCREILTPRQVVQLVTWINENTEMLESVCPGWGSEHIHAKPPPPSASSAATATAATTTQP